MADEVLTPAQIDGMTISQLKKAALELYDADDIKGLNKDQLKEQLKSFYAEYENSDIDDEAEELNDEVDDEELELDDDEEDDTDEPEPAPKRTPKNYNAPARKPGDTATHVQSKKPEPNGETYTAKQVATRIGTDAKTLRKFFRSPASTIEPCGQGGRYEFAKTDLGQIKAEFEKWNSTKGTRAPAGSRKGTAKVAPKAIVEENDEDLELEDDELDGPADEELEDVDVLSLDDELEDDDDDELDE